MKLRRYPQQSEYRAATTKMARRGSSTVAVILLIIVGLAEQVYGMKPKDNVVSASQQFYDAVVPEDKEAFIKYYLDKALEERIPDHTSTAPAEFSFQTLQEPVEPPPNFAANLLNHFETNYGLTDRDVYEFVHFNTVCFPQGWCFDPDDVGNMCCPF